jgi:type I site-specific restriction-modification system R (restriction) subunit
MKKKRSTASKLQRPAPALSAWWRVCYRPRLLDYVENFVLFHRETNKILAQNHQFIGVNHALSQFEERNSRGAD